MGTIGSLALSLYFCIWLADLHSQEHCKHNQFNKRKKWNITSMMGISICLGEDVRISDKIDTVLLKSLSSTKLAHTHDVFTGFCFYALVYSFCYCIRFQLFSFSVCVCCFCLRRTGVLIDVILIFSIPHSTSQPQVRTKNRQKQLHRVLSFECRGVYFYFSCFSLLFLCRSFANSKSANSKLKFTIRSYIDICAVVKFQRFFSSSSVDVLLLFSSKGAFGDIYQPPFWLILCFSFCH